MRPFRAASILGRLLPAALLASCNHALPPLVTLDGRDCAARPDLAGAQPIILDPDKDVTVRLDATAPCVQAADGTKSVYGVFRLPQSADPYVVSVTSTLSGRGLFSPRLMLVDREGTVLREVPRDDFVFHGTSLYAGIRSHADEAYMIVASDPQSVGQQVSQTSEHGRATSAPTGGGGFLTIGIGSEKTHRFTYSHNGVVTVSAQLLPKAN
ncbi:MAG: hypothetical protein JO255_04680 [Alphaproteobacteria bacterium]|nr:hypothetical protein [Alphaproteobacteria bacterium]